MIRFEAKLSVVNSTVGQNSTFGSNVSLNGSRLGENTILESNVKVENSRIGNTAYIYRNVHLSSSELSENCIVYPDSHVANARLGAFSYIGQNSYISLTHIGKFCSLGPNLISGWGIHPTNGISTHPMFYSSKKKNRFTFSVEDKIEERKSISIGNDVFIGMNVILLDGVSIGDGAVIGAGAVVSKDIPPYAIAVGCPIRIVGYRFSEEVIEKLLSMKWWDWEFEKLKEVERSFFNVDEFIKKYRKV
ncbi:MAG: antibiotic acetyltransferase [Bacteroidia bacterium]|nr:antibiotic acetyltransferase [Bacteroidia bacterium]